MMRTDIAEEKIPSGRLPEGVERKTRDTGKCRVTEIRVNTDEAGKALGKPVGRYVTIGTENLSSHPDDFTKTVDCIAGEIRALCGEGGDVLVVGLGNTDITPDALGPLVVSRIVATRHLENELPEGHELSGLPAVSAMATGVLGQTGIESSEMVRAVCEKIHPRVVIAVDALACSDSARLGRTVQLSDTGISPGSGVENKRKELSRSTLGVPVVAIGVPTVVDMHTIVESLTGKEPADGTPNMMVTPRDVDRLVARASKLIGFAVNRAFLPDFSFEELEVITGG